MPVLYIQQQVYQEVSEAQEIFVKYDTNSIGGMFGREADESESSYRGRL